MSSPRRSVSFWFFLIFALLLLVGWFFLRPRIETTLSKAATQAASKRFPGIERVDFRGLTAIPQGYVRSSEERKQLKEFLLKDIRTDGWAKNLDPVLFAEVDAVEIRPLENGVAASGTPGETEEKTAAAPEEAETPAAQTGEHATPGEAPAPAPALPQGFVGMTRIGHNVTLWGRVGNASFKEELLKAGRLAYPADTFSVVDRIRLGEVSDGGSIAEWPAFDEKQAGTLHIADANGVWKELDPQSPTALIIKSMPGLEEVIDPATVDFNTASLRALLKRGATQDGQESTPAKAEKGAISLINAGGKQIVLAGEVPSEAVAQSIRDAVSSRLPAGLELRSDIIVDSTLAPAGELEATLKALPTADSLAQDGFIATAALGETWREALVQAVYFATGEGGYSRDLGRALFQVRRLLAIHPEIKFEVAGHTDDTGNEERNRALSLKRAQTVADYLVKNGIDSGKIKVIGLGSSKPKASNDTKKGRTANRRVEVRISNR